MKWADMKPRVIDVIEFSGFEKRGESELWSHELEGSTMICVVDLSKIPGPGYKMDIFLLDEERPTEREYTDHNSIVEKTQEAILNKINEMKNSVQVEEKEKPTPTQVPKKPDIEPIPKAKPKKKVPPKTPKTEKPTDNLPAVSKSGRKVATWAEGLTDDQIDAYINKEQAKKALIGGELYAPAKGKSEPTAKAVQEIANEYQISYEILKATQDEKGAYAHVKSHLGDQYVESVVYLDFENERRLKMIELIQRNPHILDGFKDGVPMIKMDAMINVGDKRVLAALHLVGFMLRYVKFALRSAITTAGNNNNRKLLNREWQSKEERDIENTERDLVQSDIEAEKEMRRS